MAKHTKLLRKGEEVSYDNPRQDRGGSKEDIPKDDLGHQTRFSDSSLYDYICVNCGATDGRNDNRLNEPCPTEKK